MEIAKRIYIGSGLNGQKRLGNLKKLADIYWKGNVSALFNDAVNKLYALDPTTGEQLPKDSTINEPRAPKWPTSKVKRLDK